MPNFFQITPFMRVRELLTLAPDGDLVCFGQAIRSAPTSSEVPSPS